MIDDYEIQITEARTAFSHLVRLVRFSGERVRIGSGPRLVAALVPTCDVRPLRDHAGMTEIEIPISEARARLCDLVGRAEIMNDRFIIYRHGRRVAALVSWEDYLFLREHKPSCARERELERLRAADESDRVARAQWLERTKTLS